ncbi:carboxypeptidase regulatory-like domain-containing protein [Sphingomonas sp. JC676]|uniref:SdrD B-like domain-containing protein n=1 Tax=Sphingomonas sp. JC676 TaxID=2768065 RepID=UPI001657C3BF|nr:SdrD B-like domain-containing protein [Sphingomonas sp. JC676]MBC9035189.1 carboxypeptidase regulatory-like domain-containing protein [Sphingomonas sp. JC676]
MRRILVVLALLAPLQAFAADLQVSGYSWLPDPVPNGAVTQFTVRVTNNGPGTVSDAVVTIAVSSRFRVAAGDFPSYCALSGAIGSQMLTCSLPTLAVGDRTFTYSATAIATGSANTTATISSATAGDSNAANDALTVTPAVQTGADLSVVKNDGLATHTLAAGGIISYQIVVTNAGPDTTSAIRLTDNLPPASDFQYQSAGGTNWNCSNSGTTVTCNYGGGAATGALPTITVTGKVIRQSSGTITNNAFASLTNPLVLDPDAANNAAAPVVTTILEGSDLRASKAMPATIVEGSGTTINLTIFNDGPQAVAGATISDTIASNFTLGTMPAGCAATGQAVTCNGGTLASGASRSFAIPVTADSPTAGNQTNSAAINLPAGFADPDLINNIATAPFRIVPPTADLSVSKSKTPNPVAAGGDMTSTITVRNNGPSALSYAPGTPIRITDAVSADETLVSSNAAWSCAQLGNVITCDSTGSGTLALNATLGLSLVTRASATANADLNNTACSGATGGSLATPADTNAANDCSGAGVRATTVTTDLTVVKEVALNPAGPWSQAPALTIPATSASFYIRLRASNLGSAPAGTVTVTDSLPNSLNATGYVTGFGQISASSGNTSYTASSGQISWTLTNLGAGATETAIVRIDRPVNSGTFTNTANITSSDTIDSDNSNNSSQAQYTVAPLADMQVTGKSISPNPARVGVVSTYTISVRNNGANPAANVVVSDTIDPSRFELVGSPASTKGGSSCGKDDATGVISCSMGQFTRGQAFQVTQQVRARFPFGGATTGFPISHTNIANVATDTDESDTTNNSGQVTHNVTAPGYDLAITKQEPGPEFDPLRFGEELVYDLRVSNFGPSRATNVVVADVPQPPSGYSMTLAGFSVNPVGASGGFTLYAPPSPACVQSGANVECRLHASSTAGNYLDALNQVIFRLRFTPGGPAPTGPLTFTDEAQVTALEQDNVTVNQADSQLANNRAVQTTTVLPSADLEVVSKTRVGASPASINEPVEYAIVIRNNGISPINQVRVTDTLPAGFELAGPAPTATAAGAASIGSINCTGTTSILCTLDGSFPPDGSLVTLRLRARATYPYAGALLTDQVNTASIAPGLDSGGQELARDAVPANDSKTAAVQIAQSSLAGSVFDDANLDNAVQASEGLAGVTVVLSGTDAWGNPVAPRTLVTDAGGNFLFDRLPAGTYQIVETQPAGLLDFRETAGSVGGVVNNGAFGSAAATNSITAISLPANTAATSYLFQETRAGSIEGTVWRDANNNGAIDLGETGVGPGEFGATPQIRLTGSDYAGGAVNLTTTVDANGHYRFTDLPPSDATGYTVTQLVQPTGLSDGLDTNGAGTIVAGSAGRAAPEDVLVGTLAPGQALTERNFGEIPTSTLSGIVFLDPNGNATRDAGENSGLAGAVIRLTGTNDLGQAVDCSITTDATGAYSFPASSAADPSCRALRPGTYTVTETPPPGLEHSGAFIGSAGGSSGGASGANTAAPGQANSSVSGVVIGAGTTATRYDFGATGRGIGGYVYLDRNNNGVRDPGEVGIAGVTVTLSGATAAGQDACTLIACTATTDAAGNYLLVNVPGSSPAGYTLTEQAQTTAPLSAFADGTDAAGQVNGSVHGTAGNDAITGITLGAGDLGINYAFGERAGSLAGATYIDGNDDGIRQPGETALAGIVVTLSGTTATGQDVCLARAALDPALGCTATTGADGGYRFDDLPAGSYTLVESQPSAYADGRESAGTPGGSVNNGSFGSGVAENRIATVTLGNGTAGTGYDFGERAITISGRVFKDPERDGSDAGSEPAIPGVTITLRQGGTVVATTVTGPDGGYRFQNLPAGSYTVEETQPAGYGSSTSDSRAINVTAGINQTIDFGDTVSTLAGSVFLDSNSDAVRGAGERGLEGVTVHLTGTTAGGASVDRTATTDATGNYRFDDLLAGTYSVAETQPVGFGDGKDAAGSVGGSVANDNISAVSLPTGTDASGYVFGEQGQAQGGVVYIDTNLNGAQDSGEPGIAGVAVELQKPDGTVVQTATTAADGHYSFTDIEAGDYVVVEQQPLGYGDAEEHRSNRATLTVGVGAPVAPVNFGERVGSLAGGVYNDTNGNGRRDTDEPAIPGVTVKLTGSDARGNAITLTTVSGDNGSYLFTGVPGGTYNVVETQPAGYDDGIDTPGTAGGTAAGDTISAVSLAAAQDATGYLFSERGAGARIAGRVWLDRDHDRALDAGEPVYADWIVELHLGGALIGTTRTGADGAYAFTGVAPGAGYQVLFRNPANNAIYGSARPNETGAAIAEGVVSPSNPAGARTEDGTLSELKLTPGADVQQQSLPLDPSGVVYDSVRRVVVPGATVRITGPAGFDPALHLLGGTANAGQVTGEDGMYQFLLLPGAPAGTYTLAVTPPNGSYNPVQPSSIIPPCVGPLAVGAMPDPLLVSSYDGAPPTSALATCITGGQTTAYYLSFTLTPGTSANVLNNNLPIDPILEGAIVVTKTTPMVNVSRGGLVPYTITARNTLAGAITGITLTDRTPAGFRYREGSATINGMPVEPQQAGRLLSWPAQNFTAGEEKTLKLVLTVGAGVGEGEHVNQAFAVNALVGATVSNIADAAVRIIPDPDFDCTDILGKVFDDRNMNGTQDEGEPGLPGVRLVTVNGLLITTDAQGRYHVTCPMIPNEDRGSNFILKLDTRTLPTGYRMTTVNPETVRLTRGKFAKLNFGAALARVVRVDVNADVFEGNKVAPSFLARVDALIVTLAEKPSILRIAYGAAGEPSGQVKRRVAALREAVEQRWRDKGDRYRLIIEQETTVRSSTAKGDAQ